MKISRRGLLSMGAAFCTYAILQEAHSAVRAESPVYARQWIARQNELAQGLASESISQIQWHDAVNSLAREVDIADIARMIREASIGSVRNPELREPRRRFIHIKTGGEIIRLPYGVALFDFSSNSIIAPHAHKNMASAHMVMEGKIRIRTFDRISDENGSLLIRPTGDSIAEVGHAAAMTPDKDNVHCFSSSSRSAMTLDVVIAGLDKNAKESHVIEPIDLEEAKLRADGSLKVPLISFEESKRKYSARL